MRKWLARWRTRTRYMAQPNTPPPEGKGKAIAAFGHWVRKWRMWKARSPQHTAAKKEAPAASTLLIGEIENRRYVFGLDWRMIPPTRSLTRTLALARDEGVSWYGLSEMEDVIGLAGHTKWLRGPHYSAPLHLASRFSQGGLELFVFELQGPEFVVIALQESRPLPGFDYLGGLDRARELIDEFLAIQRGQPIRLVGNTSLLEGQEPVAPEDIFSEPVPAARLQHLLLLRVIRNLLLVTAVLGLALWLAFDHMERQRLKTQEDLRNSPSYQQSQYQSSLHEALQTLAPPGQFVLKAWYDCIAALPLKLQGWRLAGIECQLTECKVRWSREYGTYADFVANLPAGAQSTEERVGESEPMNGDIYTLHPIGRPSSKNELPMNDLPDEKLGLQQLMDSFREWALLGPASSKVGALQLLGTSQNPEMLSSSVSSASWSLRHGLWLLPQLVLQPHVRVTSLQVHMEPESSKNAREKPARSKTERDIDFTLSGIIYVKKQTTR